MADQAQKKGFFEKTNKEERIYMNAHIRYKGFDRKESKKLEPFLPIARYFARYWRRTVFLDAPEGKEITWHTKDEDKSVYIHFFSRHTHISGQYGTQMIGYTEELFCIDVPRHDLVITGTGEYATVDTIDLGACIQDCENHVNETLISPEDCKIANVMKNHIFILPNIAYRPWDGAFTVFWEICEQATLIFENTKIIPHSIKDNPDYLIEVMQMGQNIRTKTLQAKNASKDNFGELCRTVPRIRYQRTCLALTKQLAQKKNLELHLLALGSRISVAQMLLADPTLNEEFSRSVIQAQFDQIHALEGFLGMHIEGSKLVFYTKPILHRETHSEEGRRGERKPIGQHKVIIDMQNTTKTNNTFLGIKMCPWGWKGPYGHPEQTLQHASESDPRAPCFGPEYSQSIGKVYLDQDYPLLIAMLLSYLDSDNRLPYKRDANDISSISSEPYEEKPFYTNSYSRGSALNDYVRLTREFRGKRRVEKIHKELAEAGKDEETAHGAYAVAREKYALLEHKKRMLNTLLKNIEIDIEYEKIFDIPSLIATTITPDFIWCVFGAGIGTGVYARAFLSDTMRILVIPKKGIVRAWRTDLTNETKSFIGHRADNKGEMSVPAHIYFYIARGEIGEAVRALYGYLRGKSTIEITQIDEHATEEALDKILAYLKTEVFGPFEDKEGNDMDNKQDQAEEPI